MVTGQESVQPAPARPSTERRRRERQLLYGRVGHPGQQDANTQNPALPEAWRVWTLWGKSQVTEG